MKTSCLSGTALMVLSAGLTYSNSYAINTKEQKKPNVLFVISDDQSYPHASAYGEKWIKTPGFDRIANGGILFTNAFVTSPGCAPSRASLLTGKFPWEIEHAGNHHSLFPNKYKSFPLILEENGYHVGYTGKGASPTWWVMSGWQDNPAGPEYNEFLGNNFRNFKSFISEKSSDQPFFFWFGTRQPHRGWKLGSGLEKGKKLDDAVVPGFLPDKEPVRSDLLDYAAEIEQYDRQLELTINYLDSLGMLDNTLIIVTSDNGIAMPHAKATCFEYGIHVPLAIQWKGKIKERQKADQLISLVDLMPTILDAANISYNKNELSGKSLLKTLNNGQLKSPFNKYVFSGRERHSSSRWLNLGYPQRAVRSEQYLYIRNFHPERWPAGAPQVMLEDGTVGPMHGDGPQTRFRRDLYGAYMDIDPGPTMTYLIKHREDPSVKPYFELAVGKYPAEQLFDIKKDPACLVNLADSLPFASVKKQLSEVLVSKLKETKDARIVGPNPEVFEGYKRYTDVREFPKPDWAEKMTDEEIAKLKKSIEVDESPLIWKGTLIDNGMIVGKWKLIQKTDRNYELYDLEKDPTQLKNLAETHSEVRKNLVGFYQYWKEKNPKR